MTWHSAPLEYPVDISSQTPSSFTHGQHTSPRGRPLRCKACHNRWPDGCGDEAESQHNSSLPGMTTFLCFCMESPDFALDGPSDWPPLGIYQLPPWRWTPSSQVKGVGVSVCSQLERDSFGVTCAGQFPPSLQA